MRDVVHTSRIRIVRENGPTRKAVIQGFSEPVYYGVHSGIKRFYGVQAKEGVSRHNEERLAARLSEKNGTRAFFLTDSVYISQKDIRQVQLGKGAMRTGIEFLLRHAEVEASGVDAVLVAGASGYHSRVQSLIDIGLMPEEFVDKIRLVGNTSKSGGMAYLLDKESRERMRIVAQGTIVTELAECAGFDRAFAASLAFDKAGASR